MASRQHKLSLSLVLGLTLTVGITLATDGPATSRPAATAPALSWHRQIKPWVDPSEPADTEPMRGDDPAMVWLGEPGAAIGKREGAFQFLITTRIFTYHLVGGGAAVSEHAKAFQVLVRQPDAKSLFLDLLTRGGDVAKLYALCGLCEVEDRAEFRERIKPFFQDKKTVFSQYGCVIRNSNTFGEIAKEIATGRTSYKLLYPHSGEPPSLRH